MAALTAKSGITRDVLEDPHAEIEARQELAVVRNLVQALGNSSRLGVEIGQRYHLTICGSYGFGLLASRTMRDAVELGLRYLELTPSFLRMHLEEQDNEARLILDDSCVPEDVRLFVLHRDLAALRTVTKEIVGIEPGVRRIAFREPRSPDALALNQFWGRELEFGARWNMGVVDRDFLEAPLPQANEHSVRMSETQCRELSARRHASRSLVERVRDELLAHPISLGNMESVAARFGMTSRTLRRRLAYEGVTFRRLVDELRLTVATDLLGKGELSMAQIAERLGYADVSSFSHAFKRLTGSSPTGSEGSTQ